MTYGVELCSPVVIDTTRGPSLGGAYALHRAEHLVLVSLAIRWLRRSMWWVDKTPDKKHIPALRQECPHIQLQAKHAGKP